MLPNKSNFKFQELTPITGVKPYVIRFWETEFPEISPISSENGHKIYARKDVEAILRIKKYLFEEKLSIAEAKQRMLSSGSDISEKEAPATNEKDDFRPHVKKALSLIKDIKAKRSW